jgi:hypothetical protein
MAGTVKNPYPLVLIGFYSILVFFFSACSGLKEIIAAHGEPVEP